MTWIDYAWPMLGAASFTLGLIHAIAWLRQRDRLAQLMFAIAAASIGLLALLELRLMHAATTAGYATTLMWGQVAMTIAIVSLMAFVRLRFMAGALWLVATVVILRLVAITASYANGDNMYFLELTGLEAVEMWGGVVVSTPLGESNPWMVLGTVAYLAVLWFLVDAVNATRRHADPQEVRVALLVCGSIALFMTASALWTLLVIRGFVHGPITVNVGFVGVLLIMSYLVGSDLTRAERLAERLARSEHDLVASERRMQQAADAADLGLWTLDLTTNEFWFTDTSHVLLGWQPGDRVRREDIMERVHPEDRSHFWRARSDAIQRGGDYFTEFRLYLPDGRLRWLYARGRVDYTPAGEPYAIRGIVVDRTERRQAEERFRLVVEAAPTAMLMVNSHGTVTLANRQAERMFKYRRYEMVGQPITSLLVDFKAASTLGWRGDRTSFPIELESTPLEVDGDACIILAVDDVSERMRRENEAALQRDELAHLSRVALVGEMSGSLAHELNQPLTAILSNAQAALRFMEHVPPNLAEVGDCLVHIVENDKRAAEVIRRLRMMLRKEHAQHQPLDASDVAEEVVRLMRNDLLNRDVSVRLQLASDLPPVKGDRVQLQQVLLNLMINACDAMDRAAGERLLSVATWRTPDGVEITISDRGAGIPADQVEEIFSPFVTTKVEGIGLGLAICRSIVNAHDGAIWATNNETTGATLHVALPAPA